MVRYLNPALPSLPMNVCVTGSGYVGLITGAGLATLGHQVICVDISKEKVGQINAGEPPIFEHGLADLMKTVVPKSLTATTDLTDAVKRSRIIFITVGTPSSRHGEIKLDQIEKISHSIGEALHDKKDYCLIVVKSTVIPGTTEKVVETVERVSGKEFGKDFGVAMNPEFLREGSALTDFFSPDRIIIGSPDKKSRETLKELYSSFSCPVLESSFREAEMIKYASNAMLATKISFINEIGNICKNLGIDTNKVAEGIGLDKRIGPHFLRAGIGFGGSCFPKDVSALAHQAATAGITPRVLRAVLDVNREQPNRLLAILDSHTPKGKKIAILGLAFKKDTDDVRESPSLSIIKELQMENSSLILYDPMGMKEVMKLFPHLTFASSAQEAVNKADIVLILTEWDEFKTVNFGDKLVIDGKNLLYERPPTNYEGVCW